MRNPDRIDEVLLKLKEAWAMYPDLRFNQLISAINKGQDCFYEEDDLFLDKVKSWIENNR